MTAWPAGQGRAGGSGTFTAAAGGALVGTKRLREQTQVLTEEEGEGEGEGGPYARLPLAVRNRYPPSPLQLAHFCDAAAATAETETETEEEDFLLPSTVLRTVWAAKRLSIVGPLDTTR
jgi:hypothetical protein